MPNVVLTAYSSYAPAMRALFDEDKLSNMPESSLKDALQGFITEYDTLFENPDAYNALDAQRYDDDGAYDQLDMIRELINSVVDQLTDARLDELQKAGVLSDQAVERADDIFLRDNPFNKQTFEGMAAGGSNLGKTAAEIADTIDNSSEKTIAHIKSDFTP